MDLTELAGSQVPNGLAVASGIMLIIIGICAYRSQAGMLLTLLSFGMLSAGIVLLKNLMYAVVVADTKGEEAREAWLTYANVLQYVATAQFVIATCLAVVSMMAGKYTWPIVFAAVAHAWAGLCMLSWRSGYLALDATKPVRFEPLAPGLHWACLALLVIALMLTLVALARGRKKQ